MKKNNFLLIVFVLFITSINSQTFDFNVNLISDELKTDANSVIRFENYHIDMTSQREMTIKLKTAITILNKKAKNHANITLAHDKRRIVKSVKAYYYNAYGKEIKKVKKKDFKDYSASDGFSLYNDGRYLHYSYTPTTYPFTVYYEYEIKTSNTAFISGWILNGSYNQSIEKSKFEFTYPEDIKLLKSEKNFEGYSVQKTEKTGLIAYEVENVKAIESEVHSPNLGSFLPIVRLGVNKFNLEGIDGEANNWKEFGEWYYNNLIKSTLDLPQITKDEIKKLTKGVDNPKEKAKIVYKYVQDKVRYISVQVGIGGFKPMQASAVDKLSYGDCKALTNYTATLLNAVGVEAYHALIYGGSRGKKNIDANVVSQQGNHMVLYVPIEDENLWLECTSQNTPFADGGDFTDDRDALVITPDGGVIKHTRVYDDTENLQKINASYTLNNDGSIVADVKMVSSGTQFDNHLGFESFSDKKLDKQYKEFWDNINNMNITKMNAINNKKEGKFEESVSFTADNYGAINGDRILLPINAFNVVSYVPKRMRNRKLPIEITRGFYDIDAVEVTLPSDYKIEAIPNAISVETKYGTYKLTIDKISENKLKYTREFLLKAGKYPKEEYGDYRNFRKKVAKYDKSKIVLIKQ